MKRSCLKEAKCFHPLLFPNLVIILCSNHPSIIKVTRHHNIVSHSNYHLALELRLMRTLNPHVTCQLLLGCQDYGQNGAGWHRTNPGLFKIKCT